MKKIIILLGSYLMIKSSDKNILTVLGALIVNLALVALGLFIGLGYLISYLGL